MPCGTLLLIDRSLGTRKSKFTESQIIKGGKAIENGRHEEGICGELGIRPEAFQIFYGLLE
ncbi:MAG: hypothetical protein O2911_08375 [Bacteroidetes bacterium]|nr:hypothetical protein [Bacteroidota bacterium]